MLACLNSRQDVFKVRTAETVTVPRTRVSTPLQSLPKETSSGKVSVQLVTVSVTVPTLPSPPTELRVAFTNWLSNRMRVCGNQFDNITSIANS